MVNIFTVAFILTQLSSPVITGIIGNTMVCFAKETEEFHESYVVKPGTVLKISSANGDITMSRWENDYVDVYAVKETTRDKNELAKVRVEVISGDSFEIKTEYLEDNVQASVDYMIKIPAQIVAQEIETSNGDIELRGMKGDTRVVTANGDIDLEDMSGLLQARTSNGDVSVKGVVTISEITTSNGDVSAEIRDVREPGTRILTSNGSVDLYIKKDLHAEIAVTTSMGEVVVRDVALHSKLTVRKQSSTLLNGRLGQGGGLLEVETAMGDVTLRTLTE